MGGGPEVALEAGATVPPVPPSCLMLALDNLMASPLEEDISFPLNAALSGISFQWENLQQPTFFVVVLRYGLELTAFASTRS